MNYVNKIEFIKAEFGNYYINGFGDGGILQGSLFPGANTHCTLCLAALIRMLKPKVVIELGSFHYTTSNAIGDEMDRYGYGVVHSYEIRKGGYNGDISKVPKNPRVKPHYCLPYHTDYDLWKYSEDTVVYPEFKDMTNEEIFKRNYEIFEQDLNGELADFCFVDSDHSRLGVTYDFEISCKFSTDDALIVLDNVYDVRLQPVRDFYDSLSNIKWDFREYNNEHYKDNGVMDTGLVLKQLQSET